VEASPQPNGDWVVTVVAFDYPAELSMICGLLFAYGFDIIRGQVFSYEIEGEAAGRGKIVDVFTVRPAAEAPPASVWAEYGSELAGLLRQVAAGQANDAQ
jgi:glutamate-ammonia-ligase adenylyltransferase